MPVGFHHGISADHDARFSNKHAIFLKSHKFCPELETLVDMTKVKMDAMKPWIETRVTELLGFEDEVVISFIYGLLEGKAVNGKEIQIAITGFLEKNTAKFMKELWTLVLSAQNNVTGVPQQFLDEERKKKEEEEIEEKKKKEEEEIARDNERKKLGDGPTSTLPRSRSRSPSRSSYSSVSTRNRRCSRRSRSRSRSSRRSEYSRSSPIRYHRSPTALRHRHSRRSPSPFRRRRSPSPVYRRKRSRSPVAPLRRRISHSSDSETEDRKETKRRREEEKKCRREERHRKKDEKPKQKNQERTDSSVGE